MATQTQQSKKDEFIQSLIVSYQKGLFTFEEFMQALDKVLSDFFVDKVEVSLFRSLSFEVLKVKED